MICSKSGHLPVALQKVGNILYYSPEESDTFWIKKDIAKLINLFENESIRNGYYLEARNSRGVHTIDPTGKPEEDLAESWKDKAETAENEGFIYFSTELKKISDSYILEAEQVRERFGDKNKY